jgi:serine/threonine-protein kinase
VAEHPTALLYLIANDDPAPFDSSVPYEVQDVVLKCLEKRRENRYESFAKLEKQLSGLLEQYRDSDSQFSSQRAHSKSLTTRSSKRNPYLNRVMIKNPDEFFGRAREVKRIYSRLDAARPQSISIVGERRVGKSSLLNYVYQRRNRRVHMQNHHNTIFVYMDFQQGKDLDIPKFIDILFGMFKYEKQRRVTTSRTAKSLDTLKEEIEELSNVGKRVIVLMDEFESVTTNPNFDMQFCSFLRFLANNYKVAFVTSSYSDLQQMCHDKDIADSPFFNIFSNLPLRTFSRDEAVELITVPSAREGIPLGPFTSEILELSGYFPFFIQIACSNVFEHLAENDDAGLAPNWGQIAEAFKEEASHHYSYIWDRMNESSRQNLQRIASGKHIDRKFQHVNEDLQRRGYLEDRNGDCELFSKPFRDFVLERGTVGKQKKSFFGSVFGRRGGKAGSE